MSNTVEAEIYSGDVLGGDIEFPVVDPDQGDGFDVEAKEPVFIISEVAKTFFARSVPWMRWIERTGKTKVAVHRFGARSARIYSLADVEAIARDLRASGTLKPSELNNVLDMVESCSKQWGLR